jgi:hypothetical protein
MTDEFTGGIGVFDGEGVVGAAFDFAAAQFGIVEWM